VINSPFQSTIECPSCDPQSNGEKPLHQHFNRHAGRLVVPGTLRDCTSKQMNNYISNGSVRVVVRVRPHLNHNSTTNNITLGLNQLHLNNHNSGSSELSSNNAENQENHKLIQLRVQDTAHSFQFDSILHGSSSQSSCYSAGHCDLILDKLIQGYNATIFAYGQTGAGKTHTMDGITYKQGANNQLVLREPSEADSGVVIRCIRELFNKISAEYSENADNSVNYTVKCSFVQIYQEKVLDLLNSPAAAPLKIRWDTKQEFYLENLYINECNNAQDTVQFYLTGLKKRIIAAHKLNATSSRSHCIFTLYLQRTESDYNGEINQSKLSFVDLAGSERVKMTAADGIVLKQSISINKSLFVLRKVIKSLSRPQPGSGVKNSAPIAYRDSVLTKLLKNSLGGNCILLMFACLCAEDLHGEENYSTLSYAALTKKISNTVKLNMDPKTALIKQLREEIRVLKAMLAAAKQNIQLDTQGLQLINVQSTQNNVQNNINQEENDKEGTNSNVNKLVRILSAANLLHSNAPSSHIDTLSSSDHKLLAEKFLESVAIIKQLINDNNQLRSVVGKSETSKNQAEMNRIINENEKLTEKIAFLEQTLVEANHNNSNIDQNSANNGPRDIIISDNELDSIATSSGSKEILNPPALLVPPPPSYSSQEFSDLRGENERLKSLIISSEFELEQCKKELKGLRNKQISARASNSPSTDQRSSAKKKANGPIIHLEEFSTYFSMVSSAKSNRKSEMAANFSEKSNLSPSKGSKQANNPNNPSEIWSEEDNNFNLMGSFDFGWANSSPDSSDLGQFGLSSRSKPADYTGNVDNLTNFSTSPDPLEIPFDINAENYVRERPKKRGKSISSSKKHRIRPSFINNNGDFAGKSAGSTRLANLLRPQRKERAEEGLTPAERWEKLRENAWQEALAGNNNGRAQQTPQQPNKTVNNNGSYTNNANNSINFYNNHSNVGGNSSSVSATSRLPTAEILAHQSVENFSRTTPSISYNSIASASNTSSAPGEADWLINSTASSNKFKLVAPPSASSSDTIVRTPRINVSYSSNRANSYVVAANPFSSSQIAPSAGPSTARTLDTNSLVSSFHSAAGNNSNINILKLQPRPPNTARQASGSINNPAATVGLPISSIEAMFRHRISSANSIQRMNINTTNR
jgi:hypothetical protein